MFNALVVQPSDIGPVCGFEHWDTSQLSDSGVLIQVAHSSLNYKDALAVTGRGKILRSLPMIPGIDLAGTVVESASPLFKAGDAVILCGGGLGEDYNGGLAQYARVPAVHLVQLPRGMTFEDAMAAGTAGFTAMLAVLELIRTGVTPDKGRVIVSGASGGLGSIAVAILAQQGFTVSAISGRPQNTEYLTRLGASEVLPRQDFSAGAKPLEKQLWAGAIDTVGNKMLAKLLAQMSYGGAVASCGLAGGHELHTTVMPFILRGVKLLGINSTFPPHELRLQAWQQLAKQLDSKFWQSIRQTISLNQVPDYSVKLLAGEIRGRLVVDVNK